MTAHVRDEEIQDALDGRVQPDTLRRLREHADSCEGCRARWRELEALKQAASRLVPPEVPLDLGSRVAAALDAEDLRAAVGTSRPPRWLLLAAGVAGLLALGVVLRLAIRPQAPAEAAQTFRDVRSGRVDLALRTKDPAALERYLAGQGVGFRPRVFDLAMMKQHLQGGTAIESGGRPAALFAYRGEDGSLIVCQMYRGALADLPEPQSRRQHNGIPFQIYESGDLTIVFWPEGDVLCVLVGDGPPDAVVALAFAKAMRAASSAG